jgi:hypothetical protein
VAVEYPYPCPVPVFGIGGYEAVPLIFHLGRKFFFSIPSLVKSILLL